MYDVLMTVEKIRPTVFLLENVQDLVKNERFRTIWSDLMDILVQLGGVPTTLIGWSWTALTIQCRQPGPASMWLAC